MKIIIRKPHREFYTEYSANVYKPILETDGNIIVKDDLVYVDIRNPNIKVRE